MEHAGQAGVDAVGRGAGGLRYHVGAGQRAAEERPVRGVAKGDAGGRLDAREVGGEVGVGDRGAARGDDGAALGAQVLGPVAQALGGRELQGLARERPCGAHALEGVDGGGRAAGGLDADALGHQRHAEGEAALELGAGVVGVGQAQAHQRAVPVGAGGGPVDDAHAVPVEVHLLGDERCQRGVGALAHLGAGRHDGDALAVHDHEGVEGVRALAGASGFGGSCAIHQAPKAAPPATAAVPARSVRRVMVRARPTLRRLGSPPRGWPRGCGGRRRSGRGCRPWRRRSRRRWVGGLGEKGGGLHDLARLAIAALGDLLLDPRRLDGVERLGRAQPLDGGDGAPDVGEGDLAGAHRLARDVDGAGAAGRDAAAVLGAGEPQRRRAAPTGAAPRPACPRRAWCR